MKSCFVYMNERLMEEFIHTQLHMVVCVVVVDTHTGPTTGLTGPGTCTGLFFEDFSPMRASRVLKMVSECGIFFLFLLFGPAHTHLATSFKVFVLTNLGKKCRFPIHNLITMLNSTYIRYDLNCMTHYWIKY